MKAPPEVISALTEYVENSRSQLKDGPEMSGLSKEDWDKSLAQLDLIEHWIEQSDVNLTRRCLITIDFDETMVKEDWIEREVMEFLPRFEDLFCGTDLAFDKIKD